MEKQHFGPPDDKPPPVTYLGSLGEYVAATGHWWWAVLIGIIGEAFGYWNSFHPDHTVPPWVWVVAMILTALIAPFIAFHKQREKYVHSQHSLESRVREMQNERNTEKREFLEAHQKFEAGVKQIEKERGETIAQLQAEVAKRDEQIAGMQREFTTPLTAEAVSKWDEDNGLNLHTRLVVRNASPRPVNVRVLVESITIIKSANEEDARAVIDRLKECYLLEIAKGECVRSKEFYFLDTKKRMEISLHTREHCQAIPMAGRKPQMNCMSGMLPRGVYRVDLLVMATGRKHLKCSYIATNDGHEIGVGAAGT